MEVVFVHHLFDHQYSHVKLRTRSSQTTQPMDSGCGLLCYCGSDMSCAYFCPSIPSTVSLQRRNTTIPHMVFGFCIDLCIHCHLLSIVRTKHVGYWWEL